MEAGGAGGLPEAIVPVITPVRPFYPSAFGDPTWRKSRVREDTVYLRDSLRHIERKKKRK